MFTGIVEGRGELLERRRVAGGTRLVFGHPFGEGAVLPGDSVCVSGACLTAVEPDGERFGADVSPESLDRTCLGAWRKGTRVNLERALTPTSRMGGHFVTGHVDGLGELLADEARGGAWTMRFRAPRELARYLAGKGSVAIDGVSLTVASVEGRVFTVAVIPTTRDATSLGELSPGARVHLEMDVLAKYVESLLRGNPPELTREFLEEHGFPTR